MFDRIRSWLSRREVDGVQVRYHKYRDRLDLTNKPLILLTGEQVDSARELIPFLLDHNQMENRTVGPDEIVAYNGETADEIHAFGNVTQAGANVTRLLVREGRIVEITLKG